MNLFGKLAEITSPLGIDYYEAMLNNGNDEMCDYVRLLVNEDNEV